MAFSSSEEVDKKRPTYSNGVWTGVLDPVKEESLQFRNVLLERLRMFPDRVGQIDALTGEEDTYGSMADRAVRCALWLKNQNLQHGDVVGICTYNHLNSFVPLLASLFVGAVANSWWDATLDDELAEHFLLLTKPKVIFADDKTIRIIDRVVKESRADVRIIALKDTPGYDTLSEILSEQDSNEVDKFRCKDLDDVYEPALILYTSGTTGAPKGALHSYAWLSRYVQPVPDTPSINFWSSGLCWASGVMNTLGNISQCSTSVVYPSPTEEKICQLVEKYKIDKIMTMNTANAIRFSRLESVNKYDLSSLKLIVIGGSVMLPEVDEYFHKKFPNTLILHGYGCTEVGGAAYRTKWTGKPASCGQVAANCQVKIVNLDTGKTLGPNDEGEICVKCPYTMLRYYNNEESTRAIFDDEGWLHTGDLGYYDDDGEFFIVDRHKELIKFRHGTHVSPSIIETVILKHPDVFEVGVVAKPHLEDIEQPIAFISRHTNTKVTEKDIIDLVANNLPDHMHLRGGAVILDQLPHTDSGKIAKKELRRLAKSLAEKNP